MEIRMKLIITFLTIVLYQNFILGQNRIYYLYNDSINVSLINDINKINKLYPNQSEKIYALISSTYNCETEIVLNNYSKFPNEIKKLIKSTNRFILLKPIKIPLIFYFDNQSNFMKSSKIAHLPNTGYLIKIDCNGNIKFEGHMF
jgi:hypothetical protein